MMKKAIEYLQFFKEELPEWIHVYLPDTLGPFEIAHSVYGDNIFYEIYDDSSFIHYLFVDYKKCYFGLWPRQDGENLEKYIRRMKNATAGGERGLLLHFSEVMFSEYSCQDILQKWREIMRNSK